MSDARERILANVRRSLRREEPLTPSVARGLKTRLTRPTQHLQPAFEGDPVDHFASQLSAASGTVAKVSGMGKVSAAVGRFLKEHDLERTLVAAADPVLENIRWSKRFEIERRAAGVNDVVSVTGAFLAVAETGSLVLLSGPESPTTLNFLPENHIVVLPAERVVPHLEDVWVRLRKDHRGMPRTVNLITGPSKTGDVEQTIQEGAHGPRRLHVILVA